MIKKDIEQFNTDVMQNGGYLYTNKHRLSSYLANERGSRAIFQSYDFTNKTILDIGCGDGSYTLEFLTQKCKKIIGIDPASEAIRRAQDKVAQQEINDLIEFQDGSIYALDDLLSKYSFDCIVLRGVLHHLPNPKKAIQALASFKGTLVILEPNGLNPILKLIEKLSTYHVTHEEQSFFYWCITSWLKQSDFSIKNKQFITIVPFFCPSWMAKICRFFEPVIEKIPLLRAVACGQIVIVAEK